MNRKIIIGDIHGCLETFQALLDKIGFGKEDQLYLLGDYIDRGPSSKQVLDKIFDLQENQYSVTPIRGNHEQILLNNYKAVQQGLRRYMDEEFHQSFGIDSLAELPKKYIDFCNHLPLYHLEKELILVHAGLNFHFDDPFESHHDLLWIRDWHHQVNYQWLGKRIIIHGHTMTPKEEIERQFKNIEKRQIINIDCGACLAKQMPAGLGRLCAFDFTNKELFFQENIERVNFY